MIIMMIIWWYDDMVMIILSVTIIYREWYKCSMQLYHHKLNHRFLYHRKDGTNNLDDYLYVILRGMIVWVRDYIRRVCVDRVYIWLILICRDCICIWWVLVDWYMIWVRIGLWEMERAKLIVWLDWVIEVVLRLE